MIVSSKGRYRQPQKYVIRLGEYDMTKENRPHVDIVPEAIFVNHGWRVAGDANDVALIKLSKPAPIGKHIRLAQLPSANQRLPAGQKCTVIGWGKKHHHAKGVAAVLRHVQLDIIPGNECAHIYGRARQSAHIRKGTLVCAGTRQNGKGSCFGDSGGPLACKINGKWMVMGVVSGGRFCGSTDPGYYTFVPSILRWMKGIQRKNSK